MPAGRPTKLTQAVRDKILEVVRDGNYREVAAEYAGISPETLSRWMRRGEEERTGAFAEFRQALLEAETSAEIEAIRKVRAAGGDDAKHLEWWLERKRPERWGRKDRVALTGPTGGAVEVKAEGFDAAGLSTELLRAIVAACRSESDRRGEDSRGGEA